MSRKHLSKDDAVPPPPSHPPPPDSGPPRKAPPKAPKSPSSPSGKGEHASSSSHLTDGIRKIVSQKKNRYQKDGFDLDLTYIFPHIIAMGFPSSGTEGVFRNPIEEVKQFFTKYHDKRYKIYNLCSERSYEAKEFGGNVGVFAFDDHNPPPLTLIPKFCQDAAEFLKKDKKNVVAVHCKAGKGRTGCLIACLLLHLGQAQDAKEALHTFGANRTSNAKGVTIPSQIRYVGYYDKWLKQTKSGKFVEPKPNITITGFLLQGKAPDFDVSGGCDPYCVIEVLNDNNELIKFYDQKKR